MKKFKPIFTSGLFEKITRFLFFLHLGILLLFTTFNYFDPMHILRLRLLAVVFPLGAWIQGVHGQLFSKLVGSLISDPGKHLFFPGSFSGWKSILNEKVLFEISVMLVIWLVIQVFLQAAALKKENDLTI